VWEEDAGRLGEETGQSNLRNDLHRGDLHSARTYTFILLFKKREPEIP